MNADRVMASKVIRATWAERFRRANETGTCMGFPGHQCENELQRDGRCRGCLTVKRRLDAARKRQVYKDRLEAGECVRCARPSAIFSVCLSCRARVREKRLGA